MWINRKLLFVEADTTNLITFRVKSILLERLVHARSRPPIGCHFYRPLGGIFHDRFAEGSAVLALKVFQLFAPVHVRLRCNDAV